jgi:predicted kinase
MIYFVVIRGPLGIGKSTIAKQLAELLNGDYISIDAVLEENGLDKVDEKEGCIPVKNFIRANEIAIPKVRASLNKGKVVVFDGNFYHREQLDNLIKGLKDYKNFVFTLKAPLEICIERDSKRKRAYGKDAAAAVHCLVSKFDYGLIIDSCNKTPEQTVKEITLHLPIKKRAQEKV